MEYRTMTLNSDETPFMTNPLYVEVVVGGETKSVLVAANNYELMRMLRREDTKAYKEAGGHREEHRCRRSDRRIGVDFALRSLGREATLKEWYENVPRNFYWRFPTLHSFRQFVAREVKNMTGVRVIAARERDRDTKYVSTPIPWSTMDREAISAAFGEIRKHPNFRGA